jgi:hypothetical protein
MGLASVEFYINIPDAHSSFATGTCIQVLLRAGTSCSLISDGQANACPRDQM